MEDLLTPEELIRKLQITKRQLYDKVQRRSIPHRRIGRLLRFSPREIDQWTREQAEQ